MEAFTIELAGIAIAVRASCPSTRQLCRDYLTQRAAELTIVCTPEDLRLEREISARKDEQEGIAPVCHSDAYLETLALYRKIAAAVIGRQVLLVPGSAAAVDGQGYLFCARSGVGKSTHAAIWRQELPKLGHTVFCVNDDKPLLRVEADGIYVCGTPWDGKHRLSRNCSVPLRAVCFLSRGTVNEIRRIPRREAWPLLLAQSFQPPAPAQAAQAVQLIDAILQKTAQYMLRCNMDPAAARIAFEGMQDNEI